MKEVYLSNYLQSQYDTHSHKALMRSLYSAGFIVGSLFLVAYAPAAAPVSFAIGVGFMVSAIKNNNAKDTFAAGMQGENRLRAYLHKLLSDKYTAFFNVPTGLGDIDCLVTGPSGLFAFEVKNHKGLIGYKNGRWSQVKIGNGGTAYRGSLKNPSGQLVSGIMRLREYLKSKGLSAWINGCVVFTNPESRLRVEGLTNIKAVQINELNQVFTNNAVIKETELARVEDAICAMGEK